MEVGGKSLKNRFVLMKRLFSLLILGIISLSSLISIAATSPALALKNHDNNDSFNYKATMDGARRAFKAVVDAAKELLDKNV